MQSSPILQFFFKSHYHTGRSSIYSDLSLWTVHHLCLLLGEPLADALASSHELGDTAADTSGLAGDEGLGGEVVDAGVEAAVDQAGEHLRRSVSGDFLGSD